jgi:diacylglycerol O-acyltransferase / wax synthase
VAAAVDRLTPLDATFLELEEADEAAHMHIGSVLVFEPSEGSPPPSLQRLRRRIQGRLEAMPRYRCRLSEPHTGGLRRPAWTEDPGFSIDEHVHRAALPAPGGDEELFEWAAGYWSDRLDRRRPLWDACLVTGLDGGRWAIATKTHHAMVDGVGSVGAVELLLDNVAGGAHPDEPVDAPPGGGGGPLALLDMGLRRGLSAARHPDRLGEALSDLAAMGDVILRDEVRPAPSSSINVPIGTRRRYRLVRAELDDVKEIKRRLGGTVNDVVLAVVAGGLRELLLKRGDEMPAAGLRAMVPVNLRGAAERFTLGNHVSSLFVHLPVAEPDSGRRYLLIEAEASELKTGGQAAGGAELVALAGLAPPVLHALLARSAFATRLFNITVTNVPGPQRPLRAFGARMTEILPLVPLAADHAVGVAVVSYRGRIFFGLNGDERSTSDLDVFAAGIEAELQRLRELADSGHATPALS